MLRINFEQMVEAMFEEYKILPREFQIDFIDNRRRGSLLGAKLLCVNSLTELVSTKFVLLDSEFEHAVETPHELAIRLVEALIIKAKEHERGIQNSRNEFQNS